MSPAELAAEIAKLDAEATPGPWHSLNGRVYAPDGDDRTLVARCEWNPWGPLPSVNQSRANAQLIAVLQAHVPEILAALRAAGGGWRDTSPERSDLCRSCGGLVCAHDKIQFAQRCPACGELNVPADWKPDPERIKELTDSLRAPAAAPPGEAARQPLVPRGCGCDCWNCGGCMKVVAAPPAPVTAARCKPCGGTGEVVTDYERGRVVDCSECLGTGTTPAAPAVKPEEGA